MRPGARIAPGGAVPRSLPRRGPHPPPPGTLSPACVAADHGLGHHGPAWNIISGYAGQISFGHQVFFGLGAYTTVLLMVYWHITPWLGLLASLLVGVVAAVLIGLPTFRLAGIYFALATLAYPLTLQIVMDFLGYQEVTPAFIREKPWLYWQFKQPQPYSWLFLGLLMATLLLSHVIERSRLGYYLRAIKENEQAAAAMGWTSFATRCWPTSLVRCQPQPWAAYSCMPSCSWPRRRRSFGVFVIVETLTVALVGGVGSKWGPPLGAALMIPLGEFLDARWGDTYPGIQRIAFGVALVLVILYAREGLFWKLRDLFRGRTAADVPLPESAPALAVSRANPPHAPLKPRGAGGVIMEVQGLSKAFVGLQALADVTFSVQHEEILGVIGPNGAGKTTLFNLLNGYLPADTGQVLFQGQRLTGLSPSTICKRGIGRTFQVARPFARMTVQENVMVGAFVHTAAVATAWQRHTWL